MVHYSLNLHLYYSKTQIWKIAALFGVVEEPEHNEEWNNQEGVLLTVLLWTGIIGVTDTNDSLRSIKKRCQVSCSY